MAVSDHVDFATFMDGVNRRNPGQPEFVQAVQEVAQALLDPVQQGVFGPLKFEKRLAVGPTGQCVV